MRMARRGRPRRPVVRDDGKRYQSVTAASRATYGYAEGRTAIHKAIKNKGKAGGHKWHYAGK